MELRQYRRILSARKNFLKGIIIVNILAIIASALFCDYVLDKNISLLTILVFGILTISLSIVYDMYRNSCYRIFINGDDVIVEFGSNKHCRIPMQKQAIIQVEKAGGAE